MMIRTCFLFLFLGVSFCCSGQPASAKRVAPPKNTCVNHQFSKSAFVSGEALTYAMSYTLMFIWTDVGEVTFTATDDSYLGKNALHFRAVGKSYPFYDNFFKVRDIYETWVHPKTLKPFYFNREVDEGGYTINNIYTFNWETNDLYAYIKRKNKPEKHDTLQVLPCSIDIVSVLYYCRSIDYSNAKINQKYPISLALDDAQKKWVVTGLVAGTRVSGSTDRMTALQYSSQHYFQRPDADHVSLDPNATSMTGWMSRRRWRPVSSHR